MCQSANPIVFSLSHSPATIYWLLQSSKKNNGLWLYYHPLDKDILFKARQSYVDPKIRLEQTRLDSLRSQKSALGADAKGAKKIDKDIERQETLLGELKDFAEKLERAAKLNFGNAEKLNSEVTYEPDIQVEGYKAFIPAPLPPEQPVAMDQELVRLLSDADRALGPLSIPGA
jgi:hypothetical protein